MFKTTLAAAALLISTAVAQAQDCTGAAATLADCQRYGLTGRDGTNNDLYAICPSLRGLDLSRLVPAAPPPAPARCVMGGLIGALAGCTPPPQPPVVATPYCPGGGPVAQALGQIAGNCIPQPVVNCNTFHIPGSATSETTCQ